MLSIVLYNITGVKHVQVNVVHCLVQYSTVKHVPVNVVHCLVQYSTVKHVQVHVVHFLVQYSTVKHVHRYLITVELYSVTIYMNYLNRFLCEANLAKITIFYL